MLIEYKGSKPSKTLTFNHKDWGLQSVVWDEFNGKVAEVTDQEFLRFLLHPDRKGLFVRVERKEEVKNEKPVEPVKAPEVVSEKPAVTDNLPSNQPAPAPVVDPITPTPVVGKSKPGPKKKVS